MQDDERNEKPDISTTSGTASKRGNDEIKDDTRVVLRNIDQSLSISSCTIDADIHPNIESSIDIKNNASVAQSIVQMPGAGSTGT